MSAVTFQIAIYGVNVAKFPTLTDRKKKLETRYSASHTSVAPQFIAGLHSPLIIQAKTRLLPGRNN